MSGVLGNDPGCSIARSLEVLGDKWTLLIVRQAYFGVSRFSDFQRTLGIAKNVLAERLATLIDGGVFERRSYRDEGERERDEYALTPAGRDLVYVMGALSGWGDRHRATSQTPTRVYIEAGSGEPVELRYVTTDGRIVEGGDVRAVEPALLP